MSLPKPPTSCGSRGDCESEVRRKWLRLLCPRSRVAFFQLELENEVAEVLRRHMALQGRLTPTSAPARTPKEVACADIDAPQPERGDGGWTRLQWAALTDNAREVKELLARGALREATAAAIAGKSVS